MDELLTDDGAPRELAAGLMQLIERMGEGELRERQQLAEVDILAMGITFTPTSTGRGRSTSSPG